MAKFLCTREDEYSPSPLNRFHPALRLLAGFVAGFPYRLHLSCPSARRLVTTSRHWTRTLKMTEAVESWVLFSGN